MDGRIEKVHILIQQKKFTEAEKIIKSLLNDDANDIHLLSLLAEVNLQQDKFDVAKTIIDNAIGNSPDAPYLYYIKARIAIQQDDYDGAEKSIKQSIALDPDEGDFYALLANVKLARKEYEESLTFANKSLELDAENLLALNVRSTALLKLNRSEESFNTIEGALREDPNSAFTHANYGWGLLEKGDHKKALMHFREALKNDPNFEYAQSGMMEALKASNPIYRLFLKYNFWIGNLTAKYQWGVILGFYFGVRFLRTIARTNEALQPFLTPLVVILSLIALSTWVIGPIGNLFLQFNPYGRFLLNKNQRMSSNFVAGSFVIFLVGIGLYAILRDDKFLTIAAFGFSMMLPLGAMFSRAKYKYALIGYVVVMAIIGISAISVTFSTGEIFNVLTPIYIIGFVVFQWVSNFLVIKENNK